MREKIDALMSIMGPQADAVIGIPAATVSTHSRDSKGRSFYDGKRRSLASFLESSELEYGSDDAFLLYPTEDDANTEGPIRLMMLNNAKSRDGETKDVVLKIHRRLQRFEHAGPFSMTAKGSSPSSPERVVQVWGKSGGKSDLAT